MAHEPMSAPAQQTPVAMVAAWIWVMALATETRRAQTVPGLAATLAAMLRDLARDLSGTYRPERHYMRGPGPKSLKKKVSFRHQTA